jgi:hypothetical protein
MAHDKYINWEEAPQWAGYAAQDKDGQWWWFQCKPTCRKDSGIWTESSDGGKLERFTIANGNWQNSITARPKE